MIDSSVALWINSVFANFDISITTAVHNFFFPMDSFFNPFFQFISLLGKWGLFLIILSFTLIYFKKSRKIGTAMLMAVTIGWLLTNCVFKVLIARSRPYTDTNSIYYTMWMMVGQFTESDKSFPSGHVTAAFATMTALFLTGKKTISWTAFIFAFAMCLSRIYFVVHYPSDVLGGIIIGVAAAVISVLLLRIIPEKWFTLDFRKNNKTPTI